MKQAQEFSLYRELWGKFYFKRKKHAHEEDLDIDLIFQSFSSNKH